jgi:hypothetical protein
MTERHYNEDEVAAIFRAAAEGPESPPVPGGRAEGLTLRDLQAIAREVDIPPDAISRAAQSLERLPVPAASQTFLGIPISAERTVALQRRLTDAEWELLVVELRQVFGARGTVRVQGSMREWSNGNLHALLEPTPTGHQLRLGTFKGGARASVGMGAFTLGMSGVVGVMVAAHHPLGAAFPGPLGLATLGGILIASGALGLPNWARRRRRQMDGIVEWVTATIRSDERSQASQLDSPDAVRGS